MEFEEVNGLSECPFCGARQGFFVSLVLTLMFWRAGWFIECWGCGARGPMRVTRQRAKESWNTRSNFEVSGLPRTGGNDDKER